MAPASFRLHRIPFHGRSLEVALVNDGRSGDLVGTKVAPDVDENTSCNTINHQHE